MNLELIKLELGEGKKIVGMKSVIMPSQEMYDIKVQRSHYENGGTFITPGEMPRYNIVPATKENLIAAGISPGVEEVVVVEETSMVEAPVVFEQAQGIRIPDENETLKSTKRRK